MMFIQQQKQNKHLTILMPLLICKITFNSTKNKKKYSSKVNNEKSKNEIRKQYGFRIVLIFDRKYSFWYFYGVLNNAFDIFS